MEEKQIIKKPKTLKQIQQFENFRNKGALTAGRKFFDGKDVKTILAKLEEAVALDSSLPECLFWADISQDSYYRYLHAHPDFAERLDKLRQIPILKARQAIIKNLDDPNIAKWYLEKKRKAEFGKEEENSGSLMERHFEAFLEQGHLEVNERVSKLITSKNETQDE